MHRRPRHQIKRPPKAPTSDGQFRKEIVIQEHTTKRNHLKL
nr:MAG TPA: hypothetical protein [Caudoviricetes sp.]